MAHLSPSPNTSFGLCFFTFLVILTSSITNAKPRGLAMKLIHPDSADSPYYNPNNTIADRARRDALGSMARLAYLQATTSSSCKTDDIRAGVIAEEKAVAFMANISIGQPPIPQLVFLDTGSDLLWIQCSPCKCFQQKVPLFDPSGSSTYSNLSGSSPLCGTSITPECAMTDRIQELDGQTICSYYLKYVDGSFTRGILANETLTFETSDEGSVTVPNIVFGCGHENNDANGQPSGVLGLGPKNISLASQLGSRFSYCLGNIRDPNYGHNHIIFGDGAILQGDSTPLEVFNGLYYLSGLESISIAEEKLNIDPAIFARTPSGDGGVTLDSATTYSFLPQVAFDALSGEVQKLVGGKLTRVNETYNPNLLCYKGMIDRDLTGFPTVAFNFPGGAQLALDTYGLFRMVDVEEFCMVVSASELRTKTIFGAYAQQFYNIGFDIPQNKVYMERVDCELLSSRMMSWT